MLLLGTPTYANNTINTDYEPACTLYKIMVFIIISTVMPASKLHSFLISTTNGLFMFTNLEKCNHSSWHYLQNIR